MKNDYKPIKPMKEKVTSMDVQNCIPNHLNRNQQKYNYKQKQKNMPGLPEYIFEEGESL